ncbi:hypothetical protein [Paraflavitalea speifideaquila]|uniref:RHS repeat domain-containing protein n=1 Tax=Paraflavitalea speifideaquila TaxID=3076558 RepID=UPI0028EC4DBA|nr:hypothetical protein [Paraflavitalea speifideiaquila]
MGLLQCKPTCASCEDSVGTWDQFWLRFKDRSGVGADSAVYRDQAELAYFKARQDCKELCDSLNEAGELRKTMLMDMMPSSGQYADVSNDQDFYSVFFNSQDGVLPDTVATYTTVTDFRDENGNLDLVYDEGAGKMVSPGQLSPELFAQKFKTSWAEALLVKHPEYTKLQKYELLNASHTWDRRFEAVETYAEAKKRGYLNPTNNNALPFNQFAGTPGFIERDPLDTFRLGIFHAQLEDSLTEFRKKGSTLISMWSVATAAAMCEGTDGTCYNTYLNPTNAFNPSTMCVGELNMAWLSYRQMYLDIKRNLINAWIKSECPSCITPATIIAAGHQPHFSDAWEALAANDVDLPADEAAATAWKQKNQDKLNTYYDDNCRSYVTHWVEQLSKCVLYHPDSLNNVIIPRLIQVCKEGADADHPYGASSVKPASGYQFRSFEEVITSYNQSHGITDREYCHPYGIVAPKPYDQQQAAGNKPLMGKPTDCECSNISRIYQKYQPVAALFPSFSNYMKRVYKTEVSDAVLNMLLSMCNIAGGPAGCKFPESPIVLPPVFQCYTGDVCISCDQFKIFDADYRAKFPNELPSADSAATDSVQLAKNQRYEQFLNYKLGFTKTTHDYLEFADACGVYYGNSLKKELEDLVTDFRAYYNVQHDKYMNTYRVGGPIWRLRYFTLPDGTLQARDDLARLVDTPGVLRMKPSDFNGPATGDIEFFSQRDICVDNEYRWETRIRRTEPEVGNGGVHMGRVGFAVNLRSANNYFQTESFAFEIMPGEGYWIYHWNEPYEYEYVPDTRIKADFFNQWRTIKYVVTPQKFQAFYEDTLLVELDRTGMPLVNYLQGIRITPFSQFQRGIEIDWVKIYDKNNNLLLDESFNNGPNLATPNVAGLCPYDCQKTFRDFYNMHFNQYAERGAVSFEVVNDDYIRETGRPAPVCGADTCYAEPGYLSSYMPGGTEYLYYPHDIAATFDGGTIVAGGQAPYYLPGNNESNMAWLMRMDHRGKVLWQKNYGDSITHFKKVKAASDGGFITVGTRGERGWWKTTVMKTNKNGNIQWVHTIDDVEAIDVIQLTNSNYAVLVSGVYECRDGFAVYYYTETGQYLTHVFITTNACADFAALSAATWDDVQVSSLVESGDSILVFGTKTTSNIPGEAGYSGCIYKVPQKPVYDGGGFLVGTNVPKVYKVGNETRFTAAYKSSTGYLVNALYTDPVSLLEQPCIIELDALGNVIQANKPVLTDTAFSSQQLVPLRDGGFAAAWQADIRWDWKKYLVVYKNGIQRKRKFTITKPYLLGGLVQDITGNFTLLNRSPEGEDEPDDFWLTHTDSTGKVSCDTANTNISLTTVTVRNLADVEASYSQIVTSVPAVRTATAQLPVVDQKCPQNRCNDQYLTLTLCGRSEPVFPPMALDPVDNCSDSTFYIMSAAQELFQVYADSLKGKFDSSYLAKCLNAYQYESFTVRHTVSEYHYTLFYYDQAGNLVKTVPPAGVRANYDSLWLNSVQAARKTGQEVVPAHELASQYRFNTLNQVISRQTPDGGATDFWYDRLGRLVVSRNAYQQAISSSGKRFLSYTRYDDLGRITEVGQVRDTSTRAFNDTLARNEPFLTAWFNSLAKYRGQVIQTVYDTAYIGFAAGDERLVVQQKHVRNRVSYIIYADSPGVSTGYDHGTFYSYDSHGNVDTLLQDYGQAGGTPNMMNKNGNRWKKMVYKYDLISGKVNEMHYQPGWADQWIHRYTYDAGNKLIAAETSTDGIVWEREAKYEYYLHGPLARTIIGAQQVQGIDYAYTLQGWLKGVNGIGMRPHLEMGKDGLPGDLMQYVARDVYGFGLNYFGGDYFPIGQQAQPFPGHLAFLPGNAYRPLYNGNISSMAESLDSIHIPGLTHGSTLLYNYKYDQLNRLKEMDTYKGFTAISNSWSGLKLMGQYKERLSYDANGNILQYKRYGDKSGTEALMDNMQYSYYPQTNKLQGIADNVSPALYTMDLDNQPAASNYLYDPIGNLVKDSAEGIKEIRWTMYGKIKQIIRNPSPLNKVSSITYAYDGQGNRIGKTVERQGTSVKQYTWYVLDAQGNTLAVYSDSSNATDLAGLSPSVSERAIYGSSRLGTYTAVQNVDNGPADITHRDTSNARRGLRNYELTNHLSSVLATITDRKYGVLVNAGDTVVHYYYADVSSAQSYYPFGMVMPGRSVTNTDCREELKNVVTYLSSSDLNSGATVNGADINHNGVRWAPLESTTIALYNQAVKVTNGGNSSDGVVAYLPTSAVEANTTYVIEFDITEKSAGISYFNVQAHTPTDDVYRVRARKTGVGHHSILFTTPEALPSYIRLRITSNIISAGTYFVVDNFVARKFKVTDQELEAGTDFNTATQNGTQITADGLTWSSLNTSINSLSLIDAADKQLKVTCTNVDQAYLKTEMPLSGGKNYIMRFTLGQDSLDKRLGVRMYARTGGVWSLTESEGLFFIRSGHFLFNFTQPAGADSARIEFIRSNAGNTYDGYRTNYTIDDFSINRLDTAAMKPVMVCAGCHEEEVSLVTPLVYSDLESGVTQTPDNKYVHQGVTWQQQANGIVSLSSGTFRVENSGTSGSDGMLVVVPKAMIEPFTTYIMEADIVSQSPGITEYNIQAISQTLDSYRATYVMAGTGHRSIIFTTGATVGNYVAFRISARPATAGLYFFVDNFSIKSIRLPTQTNSMLPTLMQPLRRG